MVAAVGCVDGPSAPAATEDDNFLASSFDALSREAAQVGDSERSQEFVWAALSVRAGLVPSRLTLKNGAVAETYDAIVLAVRWAKAVDAQRAGAHRTLLAWRRAGSTLQTLMISSPSDQMVVANPISARPLTAPFAGAHVLYSIRGNGTGGTWIGVSGNVKLAAGPAGDACKPAVTHKSPTGIGVSCVYVPFTVAFDIGLQRSATATSEPDANADVLRMAAADQVVNGARLTLACSHPASMTGC